MEIIERHSPNADERDAEIDTVILHYTGMENGQAALDRLCDASAKVSAHYLIEEDGRIFQLVDEAKRAWHAGVASWRGETNINARSIGLEIVNPGHEFGYRDFPDNQIGAVTDLLAAILARHRIPPARVLAHADVAPGRKEDPGEKFPWERLAREGLAVGPFGGEGDASIPCEEALAALRAIGYEAPASGHAAAVLAFQRRFCPGSLGQGLDPVTKAALLHVLARS